MTSLLLKLKNKERFFIKIGLMLSQTFDVIEKHTPSKKTLFAGKSQTFH